MKRTPLERRSPLVRRTPLNNRSKLRRRKPGRDWWRVRKHVEHRANSLCEARLDGCHIRGVHAHHILPRSQGGQDDPAGLLWVCAFCHRWIHDHPAQAVEIGLLRRRTA